MKYFLISFFLFYCAIGQTIDPYKEKLIKSYLELSGKSSATMDGLDQTLTTLKQVRIHVPASFWPEFKKTLIEEDLTINAVLIKIYNAHFSIKELTQLNDFYKTTIGRKIGRLYTKLSTESMIAGREWGQLLAARLEEELKKKGY